MDLSRPAARLRDRIHAGRAERRPQPAQRSGVFVGEAYLVQAELAEGRELAGYKLGLLSAAKQRQMGVSAPIYGRILRDGLLEDPLELARFMQPRIEPEVAVRLAADVPTWAEPADAEAAIGDALLALDVLDSVWDGFSFGAAEVVADNASGGGALLGPPGSAALPLAGEIALAIDGEVVTAGELSELGHVPDRLCWLVAELAKYLPDFEGLRAGQVVLLGSPCAAVVARPGRLEVRGPSGAVLTATLTP